MDGAPSPFDEQCSAKMVVAYVTNPSGRSSVVKHTTVCIYISILIVSFSHSVQLLSEDVGTPLVEQVQQLLWFQE